MDQTSEIIDRVNCLIRENEDQKKDIAQLKNDISKYKIEDRKAQLAVLGTMVTTLMGFAVQFFSWLTQK
jgi:cell division septum initiation protein DivIVA